jgi:hypothetical protein
MLAHDFKRSQYDSHVYIKFVDGSSLYLLLYVDCFEEKEREHYFEGTTQ